MTAIEVARYLRLVVVSNVSSTDSLVFRESRPDTLASYLAAHGWAAEEQLEGSTLFHLNDVVVLAPNSNEWTDYHVRVSEVVRALSEAEGRFAFEVLEELTS